MARTRSQEYDSIQDQILEEAAALFAERGYAATSIGDIANACGCSKSRLYHYFDSKGAILRELLTKHVDTLLTRSRQTLYGSQEPKERFVQLVRLFLEIYAVSRNRHVVLLTCLDVLAPEYRHEIIGKQRELVAYVGDALQQLRPDLHTNPDLAKVDTMLFFGMINWTYTWYQADGPVPPNELADRTAALFLNGYTNIS